MSMTRKEQARVLLNLRDIDHAKWSAEEVRRLFDLISGLAYEEPEAGVPAGMVPWHGGDSGPADIGEAAEVLHADGTVGLANKRSILWGRPKTKVNTDRMVDYAGPPIETKWIIAYTPKQATPTDEAVLGEREACLQAVRGASPVFDTASAMRAAAMDAIEARPAPGSAGEAGHG